MGIAKDRLYGGQSQEARVAERREKLMQAAAKLYGQAGTTGVSVTAICAEAGLTPRYFYESFASREELLLAVFREVCDHLIADVTAAIDARAPADSALSAFFQLLADHPDLARVFLVETDHHDPEMLKVGRAMLARLAALIAPEVTLPLAQVGAMGAVLRIARFWIEGDYAEPVAEISALARRFVEAAR
ncbi:TetR/AcrR family transcriptional regulator [Novosphingobium sp. JCM 18896]|uniref:TetR/AcrR family transcriptional regulator n=1 Tax=Novosphingobium sp. JCM 18896 TaxID=2989731 RepID=UPI002222C627|nr:TetR/AcrR family transcriptional regulator [Novosphingobium sp. JCM 18896]MCW1431451.1 TetR/AcrR family transcriptional regulator [Novosphingobium sp. JCM 18896]